MEELVLPRPRPRTSPCAAPHSSMLPFVDERRALPVLLEALAPRRRQRARRRWHERLGAWTIPRGSGALTAALEDGDAWVRYFAVRGLVEGRHSPAAAALNSAAAERYPAAHVRIASLEGLGHVRCPSTAMPSPDAAGRRRTSRRWPPRPSALLLGALADAQGLEYGARERATSGVGATPRSPASSSTAAARRCRRSSVSPLPTPIPTSGGPEARSRGSGKGRPPAIARAPMRRCRCLVALLADRRARRNRSSSGCLESRIPALSRGWNASGAGQLHPPDAMHPAVPSWTMLWRARHIGSALTLFVDARSMTKRQPAAAQPLWRWTAVVARCSLMPRAWGSNPADGLGPDARPHS